MDNTIALAAAAVVLLIIIILVSVLRKQFESSEFKYYLEMSLNDFNLIYSDFKKVKMSQNPSSRVLLQPQLPQVEYEELSPSGIDLETD